MINIKALVLPILASFALSGAALADADDEKWINQCIQDNKASGQTAEVVQKYCACMNDQMDDNETQSITEWEKTHQKEEKECDAKAGWK